jgi:hypothetical protein
MRALLIPIGLSIVVGIAASVACSTSVTITPIAPFGTCSDATGYAIATAADCPGLSCGTYYATCDGTVYNGCDCNIPSGYTEISDPTFGDAGTGSEAGSESEAGTSEAGTEEAGTSEAGTEEAGTSEAGTEEAGSTPEAGSEQG